MTQRYHSAVYLHTATNDNTQNSVSIKYNKTFHSYYYYITY